MSHFYWYGSVGKMIYYFDIDEMNLPYWYRMVNP
jgi:hypothetical protein